MTKTALAILPCTSQGVMATQTGKSGQTFLHLLISKGHNEALTAVLEMLQHRFNRHDYMHFVQTKNWSGKAMVDAGLQSRNTNGGENCYAHGSFCSDRQSEGAKIVALAVRASLPSGLVIFLVFSPASCSIRACLPSGLVVPWGCAPLLLTHNA